MALDDTQDSEGQSLLIAPYYSDRRTETRSLREMVEEFIAVDGEDNPVLDKAERGALAESILLRWAGAEGALANDYARYPIYPVEKVSLAYTTAQRIAVIEAFQGEKWLEGQTYRHPAYTTGQKVNLGYLNHLERLYGQLMLESHLKDLADAITAGLKPGALEGSEDIEDYRIDFSGAEAILTGESDERRGELLRSLAGVYGNSEWVIEGMRETALDWVYEYEYYAEYLERGVFGGVNKRVNDFTGDCGCSGGLRDNVFETTDGEADRLRGRARWQILHGEGMWYSYFHFNYGRDF